MAMSSVRMLPGGGPMGVNGVIGYLSQSNDNMYQKKTEDIWMI